MIIFDLDGTLADCEHRRHFVEPSLHSLKEVPKFLETTEIPAGIYTINNIPWKPNWKKYYEACDQDKPINQTIYMFKKLWDTYEAPIQIWSERCESTKIKTKNWLLSQGLPIGSLIKMRSISDFTPEDVLKERWLDEVLAQGKKIDFVFDDRPKVINMWRRRGVFVFNCCQHDEDF